MTGMYQLACSTGARTEMILLTFWSMAASPSAAASGPPEGPLAELGLPRVFRWLVGLRGQLQLRSAKRGVRIIELQVRNGLPDQLMAVYLADRLIGAFELPSAGIGQLLTLRCTAFFEAGKQPITIQTACASTPDAIGRELSIIIEELVFVDGLESGTEVK